MSLFTSSSDKSRDGAEASSHHAVRVHAGEFEIVHQTLTASGSEPDRGTDETASPAEKQQATTDAETTAKERGTFLLLNGTDGVAVHETGGVRPLFVVETETVRVRPDGQPFLRAATDNERLVVGRVGPAVTRQ